MKKGFKRTLALLFASALFAAAFAGCGTGTGSDSAGGSDSISAGTSAGSSESAEHTHTLKEVPAVAARCERDGNIQYWECESCGKLFSDAAGTAEISREDTVIPAAHTPEPVAAFTADEMFESDAIAHYRCTVCGKDFSDEACTTELQPKDIYEQKTFLLSTAQVSVPESTSRVYATVNEENYTLAVNETHFALRIFLGWEIGDADFSTLIDEMADEHLEFRLNLNIDTEGTLANSQWYHFKFGYDADGAFGGFSDSDAFVHFNLLPEGGDAIEEAFLENGGSYVTLVRDEGWMIAYIEDLEGNLFELARTNCFGDTPMARISLGVNQGFVADSRYPATAKEGKLVIGTTDPYQPQTSEENPGDIIDDPPTPVVPQLSIGDPYDPGEKLWGETAAYTIEEQEDGSTKISWADGRGAWAKVWQDVSNWSADEGEYLKLSFTLERTTDVYILYVQDTTGAGETQMYRSDLEAGEHTLYIPLYAEAGSNFLIEYLLDAKMASVTAGSITISEASFVTERPAAETAFGTIYDIAASLGNPAAYTIEAADGTTTVSWADGRGSWEYTGQAVTAYKAENNYLRVTFTASRQMTFGVYMNGTALMGHTSFAAGQHTVYVKMPDNTAEDFTLNYYFDGGVSPITAGSVVFTEFTFVPTDTATIGDPYDPRSELWDQTASYTTEKQEDGTVVISWADGRPEWDKVWQDVSDYSADKGGYIKLTFTLSRNTNVYICYMNTDGSGETQMLRSDYEAGEHTVYFPVLSGAAENFLIEYYLDAGSGTIAAGSMTISEVALVDSMPVSLSAIYDVNTTLGQPTQYTVATEDGATVVSWQDGRDTWAKAQQDVSGYAASKGRYLKITFDAGRTVKFGVYIGDTALMGHTEFAEGTHTVYVEIPAGTGETFSLVYYFDAGESVKAGTVSFTEIAFVAEKPAA